jgi:hypothetical protein
MSVLSAEDLRKRWVATAAMLDRQGHFSNYSTRQRAEVLRKGYLGNWPPDAAIRMARELNDGGYAFRTPQFVDDLRSLGSVGPEVGERLRAILDEAPPESYEPPYELRDPPGHPFIFECRTFGRMLYFKFQIAGTPKKPRVLFWSCHPPIYGRDRFSK